MIPQKTTFTCKCGAEVGSRFDLANAVKLSYHARRYHREVWDRVMNEEMAGWQMFEELFGEY